MSTITIPAYSVVKTIEGDYVILDDKRVQVQGTKRYAHQTSAYAALGRLVAKEGEL